MGKYQPGNLDGFLARDRRQRRQEREKDEANRPTGTELGQVTKRLDEQQKQIKKLLESQPVIDIQEKNTSNFGLSTTWSTAVILEIPVPQGTSRCVLQVSVNANVSGENPQGAPIGLARLLVNTDVMLSERVPTTVADKLIMITCSLTASKEYTALPSSISVVLQMQGLNGSYPAFASNTARLNTYTQFMRT
ncbi:MAG: hypothetical protein M3Z40_01560 [Bifidobacterium sp.]|nr:hypothetical protein [Bifidobacterium sp.]